MQAIILAAGMGKRLGRLTRSSTKGMIHLNGKPLVEHCIERLERQGIVRIVIVVGFCEQELRDFVETRFPHLQLTFVRNADYQSTNNIYSLLLASDYLANDDTLVVESDLIFEDAVLAKCIDDPAPDAAAVARYESWMDGTVVVLDDGGYVSAFIPKENFSWTDSNRYCKTVNIYKLSKAFSRETFIPFLAAYVSARGKNQYYEEVLRLVAFVGERRLKAIPVDALRWYEIDDLQDLDIASTLFAKKEEMLTSLERRYGGYWRFSKLKDFCYLVNPYFPPARMLDELQFDFRTLLTQYPSGLDVHNRLAAQLFEGAPDHFLVGNGASELIKELVSVLPGPVGVTLPTFNEYLNLIPREKLSLMQAPQPAMSYCAADLIAFAKEQSLKALILVNPNNPTGHFLARTEILEVLEAFEREDRLLVLDESFVDFVDGTTRHSFAYGDEVAQWPNLIVVKSISKSYGVPGLRLGVMLSSQTGLLKAVRQRLPIWNINSVAEKFMQIVGKYRSDFLQACALLSKERHRFTSALNGLAGLRALPSQANFVCCEVAASVDAASLVHDLLEQHWILVKDLTGRPGIGRRQFLRLAVRSPQDNDCLVAALQQGLKQHATLLSIAG